MNEIAPIIVTGLFLAIPIIAIVGGITKGIIKTNAQHRMVELAHRERLAALEHGIDPERLTPLEMPVDDEPSLSFEQRQLRRSHGLLIGGLVMALGGIAFAGFLAGVAPNDTVWPLGFVFAAVGIALLIGSFVIRPKREDIGERRLGT
jgi:hypothetical protein